VLGLNKQQRRCPGVCTVWKRRR